MGGGGVMPGFRPPPNQNFKNTDFVDLISNGLCDLLFSQKSAIEIG
jgi:hypothetical protein